MVTRCFFAGMADNLSYVLGSAHYKAYKYVPWGRIDEVMPYLIRRAQVHIPLAQILFKVSHQKYYISEDKKIIGLNNWQVKNFNSIMPFHRHFSPQ